MKEMIIGSKKVTGETELTYVANPKRKGSKAHARYEAYETATTVAEALELGATKADLKYDSEHEFVSFAD